PRRGLLTRRQALGLVPAAVLAVSGGAVRLVPRLVPAQAPRCLSGGCAAILRPACPIDRSAGIRRGSGAAGEQQIVDPLQALLRRAAGSLALSRPLHSPRRYLKSPLDRIRREGRHLQVEGLQD